MFLPIVKVYGGHNYCRYGRFFGVVQLYIEARKAHLKHNFIMCRQFLQHISVSQEH
jgi:hypothetical protein